MKFESQKNKISYLKDINIKRNIKTPNVSFYFISSSWVSLTPGVLPQKFEIMEDIWIMIVLVFVGTFIKPSSTQLGNESELFIIVTSLIIL